MIAVVTLTTKAELSKGEGVGGRLVDCRYDLEVLLRAGDIQFSIVRAKNSVLDSWLVAGGRLWLVLWRIADNDRLGNQCCS